MRKSLRCQIKYVAQYVGATLLILFVDIFYVMFVVGASGKRTHMIAYDISGLMMVLMFSFLYISIFNATSLPMALQFSATRKGWQQALMVSKLVFVACAMAGFCALRLLAAKLYGEQPLLTAGDLVLLGAASLLAASVGGTLGLVSARHGVKWMVIATLALVVVFVGVVLVAGVGFKMSEEQMIAFLRSPWLAAAAVAACVPVDALGWIPLRKIAVRG